jgi:hypothetical protein
MTVSGSSTVRLLESAMNARKAREEASVAMLEKAQDLMTQQGEAMVKMVEASGTAAEAPRFEALA